MPAATVTRIPGRPAPTRSQTAQEILDEAAAKLAEWAALCPDGSHVRSDETPGTPRDLQFWRGFEDEVGVGLDDAFRNALDNIGGLVPAAFGQRNLGVRP
jgi:hypothetical protein